MASDESCELQFIFSSHSEPGTLPSLRRRAHAHAARVSHARRKRGLHVIEYHTPGSIKKPTNRRSSAGPSLDRSSRTTKSEAQEVAVPSPVTVLASERRDPFTSFARSFTQVEHFLFDYYIHAVIPYQSEYCNRLWDRGQYSQLMLREWIKLTITRGYSLDSILLIACRHLAEKRQDQPEEQQHYIELAVRYKLSCVKSLNENISAEIASNISDATIATVLTLACEELWLAEHSTAKSHLIGALQMIEHNGGPRTLGLNGFLESLVYKFWDDIKHGNPLASQTLIGNP